MKSSKLPMRGIYNDTCVNEALSTNSKSTQDDSQKPGQPQVTNVSFDTITLSWRSPEIFNTGDFFQIGYRDLDDSRWKVYVGEYHQSTHTLTNLKSNAKYVFRVRAVYSDIEGPYSDVSQVIETKSSPASRYIALCERIGTATPRRYRLKMQEVPSSKNEKAKSKKYQLGSCSTQNVKEKTMLLIGETGTGKSTLVDAIINYILGVNYDDNFRFTVNDEDLDRAQNQSMSQTEWITCFTIHPEEGSRLPYSLNIIDTPGFGDTRGIKRDQAIVEQIRQLFCARPPQGILTIDMVCCTLKAPDARLSTMQTYVFHSVMSLFGNDIKKNMCSIITFADSSSPPVLSALRDSGLPFGKHFTFNNTALFSDNTEAQKEGPSPRSFWEMGVRSFTSCFEHMKTMPERSLQLTQEVLNERRRLDATLERMQPIVEFGLTKISELKRQIQLFNDNKTRIEENKDFTYSETVYEHDIQDLPKGIHVTNCKHCNVTCHDNCVFADDKDKMNCSAMDPNGYCMKCEDHCIWSVHTNSPYLLTMKPVKKEQTFFRMKAEFDKAMGKSSNFKDLLNKLALDLKKIADDIEVNMETVNKCNTRLAEIALCPNPLTMTEHIDMMIHNEKTVKKDGWSDRIEALTNLRKRALVKADASKFQAEAGSHGVSGGSTNPDESQTERITCFTIHPEEGSRLLYSLNIIDTAGFGDIRGIERDQAIVERFRQLFCAKPPQGILTIDMVCCTLKAPDARLSTMLKYVFHSVMSFHGNDIKKNMIFSNNVC
ncbi:hypothetical protein DPMN_121956 [Dreissena polymorpha]|uniref:Fibronectin type-III domain-containing protein n=1 Tax=Dreissena polymorpha TaxID=45954 RepID=A0A9D4GNR3_DREPO|nr:hypothetical protein DPMN_121956 [Dreissena polymorpha]